VEKNQCGGLFSEECTAVIGLVVKEQETHKSE
jgi:hypothetical protein